MTNQPLKAVKIVKLEVKRQESKLLAYNQPLLVDYEGLSFIPNSADYWDRRGLFSLMLLFRNWLHLQLEKLLKFTDSLLLFLLL